jgi:L,D-transpeptidase ErfK/SrfK
MNIRILFSCSLLLSLLGNVYAANYDLPTMKGDTVIAHYPNEDSHLIAVTQQDYPDLKHITLLDVAKRYNLGQEEIVRLNPTVDRWLVREGEMVRIPNKRILPNTPHNGVTLNISEFRMYYYPPNTGKVYSFAHGIGRQDWKTPLGQTKIIRKVKNPVWNPPASIRREHAADGDILPAVVPAGPHNPLGTRAMYLGLPGEYRIHGTDIDKVYGIGMQITHGCVRMYPEDVEQLYDLIDVGTPVYLVKQPIKVGWLNNVLYLEAHPDLEGENMGKERRYQVALDLIRKYSGGQLPDFDQKALNDALEKLDGEPVALYERVAPLDGGTEIVPDAMPVLPSTISTDPLPSDSVEQAPAEPTTEQPQPEPMSKLMPKKVPVKPEIKTVATVNNTKVTAKPVAKTDTKVVLVKPAPKIDTKVATKPVPKTEPKLAVKTTSKPEPKVAVKPAAKTEPKLAVKPAPKVDTKVTAKPAPKTPNKTAKMEPKNTSKTAAKFIPKLPTSVS